MNEPLEAILKRLAQEREEADRLYNDALTDVDRVVPGLPAFPDPLLPLDEHQLAALNQAWNTLPAPPEASGALQQKLTGVIWRTIGPYLERQLTFNSYLVDHINRTVEATKTAHQRQVETTEALRGYTASLTVMLARLMLYLQQITGYVDTKDRDTGGRALVVNAGLSALAEMQAKYHESWAARERRNDARLTALATAHEDLRASLAVAQQAIGVVRRHVEAGVRQGSPGSDAGPSGSGVRGPAGQAGQAGPARDAFAPPIEAYKYVGFENQFRGSEEAIRERQRSYLPYFEGIAGDVLDVGCGRGEFIDLLIGAGIGARGIDLNHEMAAVCQSRGFDVREADAVGYLETLADESLGGIFAAQVVEHLEPSYLLRFLDLARQKLRPDGRIVLETLNPACWTAFFESYIRDITHRWPLHPETLKYLVLASGFVQADIEFRSPVPEQDRLQPIVVAANADVALGDLVETFNANVEKLNARMFTFMDYAIVARR